jgi:beta-galactosidase
MICDSFNQNWYFHTEAPSDSKQVIGPLSLPHDAMLLEKRDRGTGNSYHTGYFPGGVYHYTKNFFAPQGYRQKRVSFEFEGVYMNSQVYLNGQLAGGRPYGYSNFYVIADDLLKFGQENELEVVVHNEKEPNSRWYSGSGIYRNVKLWLGNRLHIPPQGVKISTQAIREQQALLEVAIPVTNLELGRKEFRLVVEFHAQDDGEIAAQGETLASAEAGQTITLRQTIPLRKPALWSLDQPNLYTCRTRILIDADVMDEDRQVFGIRLLSLDPLNGLRLNGQTIKLRGGCVHHDNGIVGACALEAAEDRRVRLMKASGFNALRSAHNPMSKAMLEACDRQGILVMDEFSDVWFRHKTEHDYAAYFRDWWKRDIQAMVDKDYNHPCVVLYSIGNEINETATAEGVLYSQKLADKLRSLDDTRYVINSINGWYSYFTALGMWGTRKHGQHGLQHKKAATKVKPSGVPSTSMMNLFNHFMDLLVNLPGVDRCTREAYATVDVAGYNYMAGRYKKDGRRYPQRVICGSETYPPEIARNWRLVKALPYVIGDFSWTAWDYLGEAGLCTWQYGQNQDLFKPYPCILADSPMIDIIGHRQTQSYIHEIVWGLRKEPYIAVQPLNHPGQKLSKSLWRGTHAIASWTWHGFEGRKALVEVYADADMVELFLNGRSLGSKPAGQRHNFKAVFKPRYQPGQLTAVAYRRDGQEIARTSLTTASHELQLHVHPEVSRLKADGADLAYINITLADENGIVNPLAERLVTVQVEGAGSLLGFGSADPFTEESFCDQVHTTYQGRALAVVRAGLEAGMVQVRLSAEECETQELHISVGADPGMGRNPTELLNE